jgi:hypothetical protein
MTTLSNKHHAAGKPIPALRASGVRRERHLNMTMASFLLTPDLLGENLATGVHTALAAVLSGE